MATSFADLKKNRKSDFEAISKKIEENTKKSGGKDEGFWQPTVDKAENGYAIIRFLPAPEGEDSPFVRLFEHAFKGPTGSWYIENSRTTLGNTEKDPVGELNSRLWNESDDDNSPGRKQARLQKRKLSFISNILVIKDQAAPENEGKVFKYKYGKKIWDKIQAAMYPEFDDEEGFNPFDMWEGADFKLKIRKVEGYRNYDKSEFDKPSAISEDDEKLEAIYKQEHSLASVVDPSNFKSYDELAKLLARVLGEDGARKAGAANRAEADDASEYQPRSPRASAPKDIPSASDDDASWSPKASNKGSDDDSDLEFFRSLAE